MLGWVMATRREFISGCSVLGASLALFPAPVIASSRRSRALSLDDIPWEAFAAALNSWFLLRAMDGVAQNLQLVEVEPVFDAQHDALAEDASHEKFSLLFRGSAAYPLGQNTYPFEHPRIGRFEMFIVPVGCMDARHCHYEAVFNRPPLARRNAVLRTHRMESHG
jgi:hypothetical protein